MLIGELSKRSGLTQDTIRYYEKLRLLECVQRYAGNQYKNYGSAELKRLLQIQQLKGVGFTLREVRLFLLGAESENACQNMPQQLNQKIETIDRQLAVLESFKALLVEMKAGCDGACESIDGLPSCVPSV